MQAAYDYVCEAHVRGWTIASVQGISLDNALSWKTTGISTVTFERRHQTPAALRKSFLNIRVVLCGPGWVGHFFLLSMALVLVLGFRLGGSLISSLFRISYS